MKKNVLKERNIALARYMGWEVTDSVMNGEKIACDRGSASYRSWTSSPPFDSDMNLLMPVVWKLMRTGVAEGWSLGVYSEGGGTLCGVSACDGGEVCMDESPAVALFMAVSSLVMGLQESGD